MVVQKRRPRGSILQLQTACHHYYYYSYHSDNLHLFGMIITYSTLLIIFLEFLSGDDDQVVASDIVEYLNSPWVDYIDCKG